MNKYIKYFRFETPTISPNARTCAYRWLLINGYVSNSAEACALTHWVSGLEKTNPLAKKRPIHHFWSCTSTPHGAILPIQMRSP